MGSGATNWPARPRPTIVDSTAFRGSPPAATWSRPPAANSTSLPANRNQRPNRTRHSHRSTSADRTIGLPPRFCHSEKQRARPVNPPTAACCASSIGYSVEWNTSQSAPRNSNNPASPLGSLHQPLQVQQVLWPVCLLGPLRRGIELHPDKVSDLPIHTILHAPGKLLLRRFPNDLHTQIGRASCRERV